MKGSGEEKRLKQGDQRQKKKADGEDGGDGCWRMSSEINTGEICKLSYSNVEDSQREWCLQLAKHPAVTSFCKLTQNPATKTVRADLDSVPYTL